MRKIELLGLLGLMTISLTGCSIDAPSLCELLNIPELTCTLAGLG